MPDPSFVVPLILQSAVLPFGVGLALMFAMGTVRAGAPLAIAAAFLASYFVVFHWSFPPKQALDWLPLIVLLALAGVAVTNGKTNPIRHSLRLVTTIFISAIVAWPAFASAGMQKTAFTIVLMAVVIWSAWMLLARSADRGATQPLPLMIVTGAAALALMIDASQLLGQIIGGLASALLAFLIFNLRLRSGANSGMVTGIAVLLLGALLGNAVIYAGFPLIYVAILVTGLLAGSVINSMLDKGRPSSWLLDAVLAAVAALIVLGLVVRVALESGGY